MIGKPRWTIAKHHIDLALNFSKVEEPCLWITHGISGSGKTTLSEAVVQRRGAIRLRSDVERKRHFGLTINERPNEKTKRKLYSECRHQSHIWTSPSARATHPACRLLRGR